MLSFPKFLSEIKDDTFFHFIKKRLRNLDIFINMETNVNKTRPKKLVSYSCDPCQFITGNKKDYNRHCLTAKHKMEMNKDKTKEEKGKDTFPQFKCKCGKQYYSRQGIHKHKQGCTKGVKLVDKVDKEMVMKLLEQNSELQKQILELASKPVTQIVNNNTKNIHNKFNLQFFLNETCKNAMNMSDFIHSLVISNEDFENMGKLGYVQGISNILIRGLNQLDQTERPCHCTDKKRQILYIKQNNVWSKEQALEILKQVILDVSYKNVKKIPYWKEEHPGCEDVKTKQYVEYIMILNQVMTGIHPDKEADIDRIVHNVAHSVVLDKVVGFL